MKILLVAALRDYREPSSEFSYEYFNLFLPLQEIQPETESFDFLQQSQKHGVEEMQRRLFDKIHAFSPDLTIFALYEDEFDLEFIQSIRNKTKTLAYFFDDDWRQDFARKWIPHFDFFTTPRTTTYETYLQEGFRHVLYSPFGFNASLYRPALQEMKYSVSFVGGFHPWRNFVRQRLLQQGIRADFFGPGWSTGMVSQQEMIDIFRSSRINLCLSNSVHWNLRYLLSSPRALKNSLFSKKICQQIKGRHFEIPACGGFMLSDPCADLEDHFVFDHEIAIYQDVEDLTQKVRHYLDHEEARARIAEAGQVRAHHQHSAQLRLKQLLEEVSRRGLSQVA